MADLSFFLIKIVNMNILRKEYELPVATEKWGWKYHHLGVPTDNIMPNERYLPQLL
jgi:hypothetical protein